jgi:hypothetical protein
VLGSAVLGSAVLGSARLRLGKMYSTKAIHKMAKTPFLAGPYSEPSKAGNADPRYKGKQFAVLTPKTGNPAAKGVLFSVQSNDKKKTDPYDVGNRYIETHPLDSRKLGFGTHDAPKKGEFLSAQRAEQYKETMKTTTKIERNAVARKGDIDDQIEQLHERLAQLDAETPGLGVARREDDYVAQVPARLFDIGRTEQGTTATMLHDGRDQFYSLKRCQKTGKPRHVQLLRTTQADYGYSTWKHKGGDKTTTLGPQRNAGGKLVDSTHLRVNPHDS